MVKPDVLNVRGPEQKWPITNVVIVVIKREFSEDTEDSQQKPQQTRRQWVGWAPPVLGRLHGRRWRLGSLLSTSLTFATAPACFRLLSSLTGISVVFWPVYPPWCCCHLVAKSCLTLSISWTEARQVPLSFTISQSLLKFMPIESVMLSNHLILCHLLHLLPSIFPSIRVLSNESALCIRWPMYWSFSFSISPSSEYSGLISFRIDLLDLIAVQGTQESSLVPQFKSINPSVLSLLYGPTLTSEHDNWENHSFD